MKKIDKKYIIIISIILILLCTSLIIYNISKTRKNLIIENLLKDSFLLVEKVVFVPINFIDEKINQFKDLKNLSTKYEKIKYEADNYKVLEKKYEESIKEIEELKGLLNLKETSLDYIDINANVINRNLGYWFNIATINKGSKDNISMGDAVVTVDGIIGEISNVSAHNSTVKLLTNNEQTKISVKLTVDNEELYGLLTSYDEEKNIFLIEGISNNKEIPENTEIVTAGLANNYPPGILVGHVTNVVSDNFDLARTIEAKPSANYNDIKYVTILSKKQ